MDLNCIGIHLFLHPLLSEIMMADESQHWWLLDSGAAATVMATASRASYGAWVVDSHPSGQWQ